MRCPSEPSSAYATRLARSSSDQVKIDSLRKPKSGSDGPNARISSAVGGQARGRRAHDPVHQVRNPTRGGGGAGLPEGANVREMAGHRLTVQLAVSTFHSPRVAAVQWLPGLID